MVKLQLLLPHAKPLIQLDLWYCMALCSNVWLCVTLYVGEYGSAQCHPCPMSALAAPHHRPLDPTQQPTQAHHLLLSIAGFHQVSPTSRAERAAPLRE